MAARIRARTIKDNAPVPGRVAYGQNRYLFSKYGRYNFRSAVTRRRARKSVYVLLRVQQLCSIFGIFSYRGNELKYRGIRYSFENRFFF